MTRSEITLADTGDATAIAGLIAEAFTALDVAAWLVPDPEQRRAVLAANFRIFVDHALWYGHIDTITNPHWHSLAAGRRSAILVHTD